MMPPCAVPVGNAAEPGKRVAYDLFFPDFGTTSGGDVLLAPDGSGTKAVTDRPKLASLASSGGEPAYSPR